MTEVNAEGAVDVVHDFPRQQKAEFQGLDADVEIAPTEDLFGARRFQGGFAAGDDVRGVAARPVVLPIPGAAGGVCGQQHRGGLQGAVGAVFEEPPRAQLHVTQRLGQLARSAQRLQQQQPRPEQR